jgi:carboxypeptidase C (cathepsin A)
MTFLLETKRPGFAAIAHPVRRGTFVLLVGLSLVTSLTAQTNEHRDVVETRHQITVGGQVLKYTARAGLLPIRDNEAGDIHAHMFFVAYTLDGGEKQPTRPLTFVWNGGPGMNSSLIHLLGFGPKRVKTGDAYPTSPPPSETDMEDNQETWLGQSDLVFVDPVGTGYSRPTKAEYATEFYQTQGDIEAVTEFIRVYRARYDAWDAPLFIVGHSYGTTRAMGVADALERRGIPLNGVVLMSGGLTVGQGPLPADLSTALAVPGMTAAAFFHRRLPPDLQRDLQSTLEQAETWAQTEYAPALAKRNTLRDAERDAIVTALARFTGLAASTLDRSTLAVGRDQFKMELLGAEKRVLGNYDLRNTRPRESVEGEYDIFKDPSFKPAAKLAQGTSPLLNRYLRSELQFKTDLLYQGPLGGGYPPGISLNRRFQRAPAEAPAAPAAAAATRAGSAASAAGAAGAAAGTAAAAPAGAATARNTASESVPPLRRAMNANPAMRVFVMRGLYDSLGSGCSPRAYTVKHLEPDMASRVSMACYGAGHDMYTDKNVRQQIKRDMTAFIERAVTAATARTSAAQM